jgi:hypothetical protein
VQAFLRMVADRRGKVLEITPRSAVRSSPLGIGSAGRAGDFTQASLAEELKESSAALGRFLGASLIRNRVGEVNGNHVGDRNLGYVALTARWCVLAGGVFGERRLSFSTLAHAEASRWRAGRSQSRIPLERCGIDRTSFALRRRMSNPCPRP